VGIRKGPTELGQQEPTMTAFITRTVRQVAIVAAFAASFSALSSTSALPSAPRRSRCAPAMRSAVQL